MATQIRIEIQSNNNDAFMGPDGPNKWDRNQELARILRETADKLCRDENVEPCRIYDVNGNQCGNLSVFLED